MKRFMMGRGIHLNAGLQTLLDAQFTNNTGSDIIPSTSVSYTPDTGPATSLVYGAGINYTISSTGPQRHRISNANDRMELITTSTPRGPMYQLSGAAKEITYDCNGYPINFGWRGNTSSLNFYRSVTFDGTNCIIRDGSTTRTTIAYSFVPGNSYSIKIVDDGTDAIGAVEIFVNSSSIGANDGAFVNQDQADEFWVGLTLYGNTSNVADNLLVKG